MNRKRAIITEKVEERNLRDQKELDGANKENWGRGLKSLLATGSSTEPPIEDVTFPVHFSSDFLMKKGTRYTPCLSG